MRRVEREHAATQNRRHLYQSECPKDLLSQADIRNFLHWVSINSSEKPSDDA